MSERGLRAEGIEMSFGGVKALDAVDIRLVPGVWTGLIGPNGSGKTTLLNVLSGLYRPTAGRITLDGRDISRASARSRARAGVVRSFQHPQLAATLTIWENVLAGVDLGRRARGGQSSERARRLMEIFHCDEFADRLPDEIPYGLRKAAELVRAVAARPAVLLLDEPAAGLSREERGDLVASLRQVREDEPELAVCLIEHDVRIVGALCTTLEALNFGRVLARGDVATVLENADVRAAYLGKDAMRVAKP